MIKILTHIKCLISQGSVAVNMVLIFFMGGVSIQTWVEKQFGVVLNVAIPISGAIVTALTVGWVLLKSGIIAEEQHWYTDKNKTFEKLKDKEEK